jgi:Tol biopolymer transport system component
MFRNKKTILLILTLVLALIVEVANADFIFGEPTNLGPAINSAGSEFAPSITADGLELYFCDNRPGGFGAYDIWVATRQTIQDEWKSAVNAGPVINAASGDVEPCISPDGLEIYFSSFRSGNHGGRDLYMATRKTREDPWETPVNLGPTVNSAHHEGGPQISSDGLSLFFADSEFPNTSVRSGGHGQADIWVTTRDSRQAEWGEPVNLGTLINSNQHDNSPSLSADGLLLFFCRGSFSQADIWLSRRKTTNDPWEESIKLGLQCSDNLWAGQPCISHDGSTIYWVSDRAGGFSQFTDIWQASIEPIVDFNSDGIIDATDVCIMIEHWLTDYPLCDIGPMPWGDGIVDVQDLIVLAEHLFEDYRLIAHWALDEEAGNTAYDSVSGYDAYLHGGPLWQPTNGKEGGALQFDGLDDYVSTPFVLDPSKNSFSAFAWIKGGKPGQVILSQRDTVVGQSTKLGSSWLWADSSYGRLITRLNHPPFDPLISESVITDGQWHHVGLLYDIFELKRYLYVDGVKVAQDNTFVGPRASDGGLYIGAGESLVPTSFFSGLIDDVRIFNATLSPEEVAALAH